MEEGVAGAVSSGPPTYIYLLRLALLLPSPDVPLSPARSILFPSFPSDIRGLPPLSPLSNLLCLFHLLLYLLLRLCPLSLPRIFHPPAQPLAHPSRLTYLKPPFLNLPLLLSSFSQPQHPSALFLAPTVSLGLTLASSFSRPLPRNAPADKQTADTLQFYAIVSFFICLLVPR